MGSTFEVRSLVPVDDPFRYEWREVYVGESLLKALWALFKEKRRYSLGCVRLNWR